MIDMKSYLKKITRPFRWKTIKILSPSVWSRFSVASPLNVLPNSPLNAQPKGSTLYAVDYFRDRLISYCEVGVNKGENVQNVIHHLNIGHSYLIDMYEEYETIYEGETIYFSQQVQDDAFKVAKENLEPFKDKITWILKYSDDAIEDLPDNIDFIYIDANHEYKYVKKDIEMYWKKVSENGILAGHDLFGSYNGVINAVHEFAMKNRLHIYSNRYDWWFIKGKPTKNEL